MATGYQCPNCGFQGPIYFHNCQKSHYGFFHFVLDVFMTFLTGGLWLIWIFIREMRKH